MKKANAVGSRISLITALALMAAIDGFAVETEVAPVPDVPPPQAEDNVPMSDWRSFHETKLDLPIAPGSFEPTWASIEKNYPGESEWLREAKYGIWLQVGPQSAGESGDWYARKLYESSTTAYRNRLNQYGHPSEFGYREVPRDWNPTKFNPAVLTKIYQDVGARFLMIQGVHHDNFDLWNSHYQPWNSVNLGPKLIRYVIEAIARDGNAAICISILPDGSLDAGSLKMLKEIGVWMRRNGEAVYGSRAWVIPGEGEVTNGELRMPRGGALKRQHADFKFSPQDFRFTVGMDGALYAFCLTGPASGTPLKIKSLGTDAKYYGTPVQSVKLLGYDGELQWKQEADGLEITCPAQTPLARSIVFKIE